jgi:hypothetical protein
VAAGTPAIPPALHPDQRVLAEPGGAVVRRADPEEAQARRPSLHQALERDIRSWLADSDQHPERFVWSKTADEILDKVAAYCRRISDSDH